MIPDTHFPVQVKTLGDVDVIQATHDLDGASLYRLQAHLSV